MVPPPSTPSQTTQAIVKGIDKSTSKALLLKKNTYLNEHGEAGLVAS